MSREERPLLEHMSRGDFLKYGGLMIGGMICAPTLLSAASSAPLKSKLNTQKNYRKVNLTGKVMRNPAFMIKELRDGRMMAWVRRPHEELTGYFFNGPGRLIWKLCDGRSIEQEVAEEYHKQHSRPAEEATVFLEDLQEKGLLSHGGYLVADGGFPEAPNGRYLTKMAW